MGYPKEYVGHYPFLAKALVAQQHAVYPMEMHCNPVVVYDKEPSFYYKNGKPHYDSRHLYFAVDVVSYFGNKLWAWEWKSAADNPLRGLKQLKNYARSFDYVCLAVENLNTLDRIIRKKQMRVVSLLKEIGAGAYWFDFDVKKLHLIEEPKLQAPEAKLHEELKARFMRYVFPNEHAQQQRKLKKAEELEKFQKQHKKLDVFM